MAVLLQIPRHLGLDEQVSRFFRDAVYMFRSDVYSCKHRRKIYIKNLIFKTDYRLLLQKVYVEFILQKILML